MHDLEQKTTISLYWKCQFLGWSAAALYWTYMGYTGTGFSWPLALLHFAGDLLIYIGSSHLYRNFSRRHGWHQLGIRKLLLRIIPALLLLGIVFMLLTITKNYLVRYWFEPAFAGSLGLDFENNWLLTFVTGIRLMAIWLLAYYGYHYAQREMRAVKETARLELIAKEAAFNHLSAQLNPHFFFNSLNSIKALVIENPQSARRAIDLLSELLRTSLYGRDTETISVQEEMALVRDYLELEKIRFEKRLQTSIQTAPNTINLQVLPLSIQVLVENAIKHGISKTKSGGLIDIRIWTEEGALISTVQSPGVLNADTTTGLGIKNLTERLQLRYHNNAFFEIRQETSNTVIATIRTPLS